jgi:hypothetical protein
LPLLLSNSANSSRSGSRAPRTDAARSLPASRRRCPSRPVSPRRCNAHRDTGERSHRFRHARALLVRFAGHDRRDRAAKRPAFHAVVAVAVAHDERAEIGVTEPERAEDVRVLRDLLDRVAGVIDDDFLRGDENAHRRFESLDIEHAVGGLELHQVQRREIAGGVIEEEILAAGIRGILPVGAFAGVPLVNGGIELHPGIAADPCAFGDFAQQRARILFLARFAVAHARVHHSRPFSAASMNSSLTRTLRFSF